MSQQEQVKILKDIFGSYSRSGQELIFHCPKCDHPKKKLSVNLHKNAFKCWVCDYRGKDIFRLVRKYANYKQRQFWKELVGHVDHSEMPSFEEQLFGALKAQEEETISLPKEFISLANKKIPPSGKRALNYLTKRGLSKQDLIRWKVGYCSKGEYEGRVVVPSFNLEGRVNYFIARNYLGNWNSYKNPPVSKNLVFNELYVDWHNDLTLVEGVFDAIVAENAVPLLGSTLSEDSRLFQEIIKHDTPIYVALDPDAEKKARRLIKSLILYGVELYKVDVTGFGDVGEMTKQEFLTRKEKAEIMNSVSYLEYEAKGIA